MEESYVRFQEIAMTIFAFLPVILLAVIFLLNKRKVGVLNSLSDSFGGVGLSSYLFPSISSEYKGITFKVSLIRPRYSAELMRVYLFKGRGFSFRAYSLKNYWFNRFLKKLTFLNPLETGDPEFDENVLVFSVDPQQTSFYLKKPEIKHAILGLFEQGFERVLLNSQRIFAQKPNYKISSEVNKGYMDTVLEKLFVLASYDNI